MKLLIILLFSVNFAFGQDYGIWSDTKVYGHLTCDTLTTEFAYIKTKAHGFYGFEDSTVTPDLTQDVWEHITNATNDLFTAVQDGEGFVIVNDTFHFNAPTKAGLHPHIKFDYGVDGYGGNNEDYEVRLFNVTDSRGVIRKSGGSTTGVNNRISIGTTAYDNGSSFGDRYVLQIRNRTNNNDFTFENGSIYMEVSHY